MWTARKSGGFNHKQTNDKEDETLWNVPNNRYKPKLSFKMKKHGQNIGKDERRIGCPNRETLTENLLMSVETDNDSRQVAIMLNKNRGKSSRWNSPLYYKGGKRLRLYKPTDEMSKSDHSSVNNPYCGYRITIPSGNKYSKEFILNSLQNLIAPDTFVPIMYKTTDFLAMFYVDDKRISEKLQNCDKQITGHNGYYLRIRSAQGFPRYDLDQTLKDKMTDAILKKYVTEKNALDMSRFYLNPDLVENYYCSLTRGPILATALKIVANVLPNLVEISLDNNQLHNLDNFNLLTKLPNLKILGICDNKISDIDQLDAISGLKLDELRLAGNPVCEEYNGRQDDYISDIRNKFSDLIRLDGIVLRAVIGFDLLDDQIVLPPAQRLFSLNANVQEIATIFFQEYFRIFDSDNRQPLLDAYDENASFSMTSSVFTSDNKPLRYLTNSRNLCRVVDDSRRRKLLKQGRLPIVACLSELPKMQHDLNSFTMDIGLVTERMMLVTLTGNFKEIDISSPAIRYFSRTFIITPKGEGYCIINEMLQILKPTKQQVQAFRSSSSTTTTSTSAASPQSNKTIAENLRIEMTVALRERTRMTLEWTVKCLNDVNWDFDKAIDAFQKCQDRGEIPSDAFEN